jgi:hypothetical protein
MAFVLDERVRPLFRAIYIARFPALAIANLARPPHYPKDSGAKIEARVGVSWIHLAVANVPEVAGTASPKLSEGLTRPFPSPLILLRCGLRFTFPAPALKQVPVAVARAI